MLLRIQCHFKGRQHARKLTSLDKGRLGVFLHTSLCCVVFGWWSGGCWGGGGEVLGSCGEWVRLGRLKIVRISD